jgi:hypothetical protein
METDFACRRVSRTGHAAVHRYYDVQPQEPGGTRLLYFEFDGKDVTGPGNVVVCDGTGADPRLVGRAQEAIGHVGAQQMWLGRGMVAWSVMAGPPTRTRIADLGSGDVRDIDLEIRSFHVATGMGLGHVAAAGGPGDYRQELVRWHLGDGRRDVVASVDSVLAVHPLRDRCHRNLLRLQNAKWSPDGGRFLVVFTDEGYEITPTGRRWRRATVKSLVVAEADGSSPRYLGEFGHHPMWCPSGRGIIAHSSRGGTQDLEWFDMEVPGPRALARDFVGVHTSLDAGEERAITDAYHYPRLGQAAVLEYDLRSGSRRVLAHAAQATSGHFDGCHVHPIFSPDERRIFFNHADGEYPTFFAMDMG